MVGKTIGVIGAGNIGTAFVRRATGFTDKILVNDLVERDAVKAMGANYVSKDEVYSQADIISLHVPLDESIPPFSMSAFSPYETGDNP